MTKELSVKRERNYGIDLLRMVSMILVAVLHVLGQGGVISEAGKHAPFNAYKVAWFLEIAAFCAVNCYAAISGYVGIKSKFKYSNIIYLWLQVFFYTGLTTLIFGIFYPDLVGKEQIFAAFFPVMKSQYWYFTAYFCMFFFTPLMNIAVDKLPRRQMRAIIAALVIIFSVLPLVFKLNIFGNPVGDVFWTSGGYNAVWLSVVYVIGAYISKYKCFENTHAVWFFILFLLSSLLTFLCMFEVEGGGNLVSYTSPTILLNGICLLIGFSKLKLKPLAKVIGFMSPLAFSVYIIHVHTLTWGKFMLNSCTEIGKLSPFMLALAVIGAALALYLVCSAIDLVRFYLFKLLHVKEGLEALEKKVCKDLWIKSE